MSKRCAERKCNDYKLDNYSYCEYHLSKFTKGAILKIAIAYFKEIGIKDEEITGIPLSEIYLGDSLGFDSLDVVDLILEIEKILSINIPDDYFSIKNSMEELISGTLSLCEKAKTYFKNSVDEQTISLNGHSSTREKLNYIFNDKIYSNSFKHFDLNILEIKETFKSHLGHKNIYYATAIPNQLNEKLHSLEMFILTDSSLFIYSFTKNKFQFKNVALNDLNLDYEFNFSNGMVNSIKLNFKTKKYISEDTRIFEFQGEENITKTLIFLSKFLKKI